MSYTYIAICLCCNARYQPDPRNVGRQNYCPAPDCQKASKKASQCAWRAKNRELDRGPLSVDRVSAWRSKNRDYLIRQKAKRQEAKRSAKSAAQPDSPATQVHDLEQESPQFPEIQAVVEAPVPRAAQDLCASNAYVLTGFLGHFFNFRSADEIVEARRTLEQLGRDISNGRNPNDMCRAANLPKAGVARAVAAAFGGPAPGAG